MNKEMIQDLVNQETRSFFNELIEKGNVDTITFKSNEERDLTVKDNLDVVTDNKLAYEMIMRNMEKYAPLFSMITQKYSTTHSISIPVVDSDKLATITGEGRELEKQELPMKKVEVEPRRIGTYLPITDDVVQFIPNLPRYVQEELLQRIGKALDMAVVNGGNYYVYGKTDYTPDYKKKVSGYILNAPSSCDVTISALDEENLIDVSTKINDNINGVFILNTEKFNELLKSKVIQRKQNPVTGVTEDRLNGNLVYPSNGFSATGKIGAFVNMAEAFVKIDNRVSLKVINDDTESMLQAKSTYLADVYVDLAIKNPLAIKVINLQ